MMTFTLKFDVHTCRHYSARLHLSTAYRSDVHVVYCTGTVQYCNLSVLVKVLLQNSTKKVVLRSTS